LDSNTFVDGILFDSADLDRSTVELDAIGLHGDFAYRADNLLE
jgi:hypothetical protein